VVNLIAHLRNYVERRLGHPIHVPEQYRDGDARYVTIHWNGPTVFYRGAYPGDVKLLEADAWWHVNNNGWDGLAYHYAIGRTGTEYQNRLYNTRLPHSGNALMNEWAYSLLVITGDGDPISEAQYAGLHTRLRALGIDRRYWLGHQEAPRSTSCPGALLMRWLGARRNEVRQPVSGVEVLWNGNIRDEPSQLSYLLGGVTKGAKLSGHWRLGKPVKGDSLWLELSGDRYVHASALDTRSYKAVI
jgi:hypothetical protein